jgi:23S rRNA (adenine2030-N6)-methyltransferase
MLSYQHSYHAGCLADVHKHALLSVLLTNLIQKERPLSYVETHSGRGVYDLDSKDSQKTGEAEQGIKALQKSNVFSKDHPYMRTLLASQSRRGQNI